MPYPEKRGGVIKKNDEKKTFVGLHQTKKNLMDQYVVKHQPVAAVISNPGQPGVFQQGPRNFCPPQMDQFQANRMGAINPELEHRAEKNIRGAGGNASKVPCLDGRYRSPPVVFDSMSDSEDTNPQDNGGKQDGTKAGKPDIITYYKMRGKDYFEVRRKSRQVLSRRPTEFSPLSEMEKMAGGVVYWDDYVPPPGYTKEELESIPIPEDSFGESPVGQPNSPYNIFQAQRMQSRPPNSPSPVQSSQQVNEILRQLEAIGASRMKLREERLKTKEEKRKLKLAKRNVQIAHQEEGTEDYQMADELKGNASIGGCGEFPKDGNDDSFLTLATQLEQDRISVENSTAGYNIVRPKQTPKFNVLSPNNKQLGGNTPVSSEFGKSFRSKNKLRQQLNAYNGRRIPTGRLDFSDVSNSGNETSPNSDDSLFEKSVEVISAQKNVSKVIVGDFCEDEDDDVFSQMPMPDQQGKTVPINEKSTVVVNSNSGSGLDDSLPSNLMSELDRMEEKAMGAKQCKLFTSTPMQNPARFTPDLTFSARRSDRIKAHNGNDTPMNQSNNTSIMTDEKPRGVSKLSRSYRLRK